MKKGLLLPVFLVVCLSGFAQPCWQNIPDDFFPDKTEIRKMLEHWDEKIKAGFSTKGDKITNFDEFAKQLNSAGPNSKIKGLTSEEIDHLVPVAYLKVFPDSLGNIQCRLKEDYVALWLPKRGYYCYWDVNARNLTGVYATTRSNKWHYSPVAEGLPSQGHFFLVYLVPSQRWSFLYMAYEKDGELHIDGLWGEYTSIEELVISYAGSLSKYIELYRDEEALGASDVLF